MTSGSTGNRDVVGFVVWILGLVVVIILVEIPIGLVTSPLLLRSGVPPSGDEIGRGTAHITSCRAEPPAFLPTVRMRGALRLGASGRTRTLLSVAGLDTEHHRVLDAPVER